MFQEKAFGIALILRMTFKRNVHYVLSLMVGGWSLITMVCLII